MDQTHVPLVALIKMVIFFLIIIFFLIGWFAHFC